MFKKSKKVFLKVNILLFVSYKNKNIRKRKKIMIKKKACQD